MRCFQNLSEESGVLEGVMWAENAIKELNVTEEHRYEDFYGVGESHFF